VISVDRYLSRRYHPVKYNCAHLVCEVWRDLYGEAMADALRGFICARHDRRVRLADMRAFKLLDSPVSPCLALFQARRTTHVGIWIRGQILHCQPGCGTTLQPLSIASIGFNKVRFFSC
jgi:hypothetical protein